MPRLCQHSAPDLLLSLLAIEDNASTLPQPALVLTGGETLDWQGYVFTLSTLTAHLLNWQGFTGRLYAQPMIRRATLVAVPSPDFRTTSPSLSTV